LNWQKRKEHIWRTKEYESEEILDGDGVINSYCKIWTRKSFDSRRIYRNEVG
jgi:hypothetical protein